MLILILTVMFANHPAVQPVAPHTIHITQTPIHPMPPAHPARMVR